MFDPQTRYAILGLARSGIAAARKLKELGGTAFLSDVKPREEFPEVEELERDFDCEFGGHSDRLLDYEVWIVSPGIPLDAPIIRIGREKKIRMISEIEFGWQIKAPDSKIVAVTGSNGKSTTASLIHHIFSNLGYKSILAGNIGSAFCSHPIQKPGLDFIVLEISSFQLDLSEDFRPDVAVLLNITPDHLNRYAGYTDYINSKFRIFENQTAQDTAVICVDSEPVAARENLIRSRILRYSLEQKPPAVEAWLNRDAIQIGLRHKLPVSELKIRGAHNVANTMAALLSVGGLSPDLGGAMEATKSFLPLAHRLEFVAEINGVQFYNDSKATNTDSVRSALTAFGRPIRVIMGGSDKGEDFGVLTPLLQEWAQKVYITGATADKMKSAWAGKVDLAHVEDFSECVRAAFAEAQPGDMVVLSPACASYDKFRNFEHRGDFFRELVRKMADEYEKK
ncbi:MAG TPA: UDP-N-acetylmuramoyl-L-alanine--D-glutamate ligase [Candidatus Syntrophosphaera sp.]|nr:UDP-N-acetylmuramoyl-L-alanine--D-glutamate ligase [Candidatus Syntrophosphaera sp.]